MNKKEFFKKYSGHLLFCLWGAVILITDILETNFVEVIDFVLFAGFGYAFHGLMLGWKELKYYEKYGPEGYKKSKDNGPS